MNFGISFAPLVPDYVVWAALVVAFVLVVAADRVRRSRGALVRAIALALFVLALANPSITREDREPLTSVAVVVVDKSPSQEFGDRTQQTEAVRAALGERLGRIPGPRSALRRGRPGRRRDRRHAAVHRAVRRALRRAARPRRRRHHDHRRARARRAGRGRGARLCGAGACADHRPHERARPPRRAGRRRRASASSGSRRPSPSGSRTRARRPAPRR